MKNTVRKIAIIISIFLLIYIGLFFIAVKPKLNTLKEKYHALALSEEQLKNFSAKKEALAKLQKDEERIDNALNLAQNIIPKEKQTSSFLIQIEAAAMQTMINIKSINIKEASSATTAKKEEEETTKQEEITKQKEKQKETEQKKESQKNPYQTISFSMNIEGDYKHLLDFLALTESLVRYTTLTNISISPSQNNILQVKIDGEIYYE